MTPDELHTRLLALFGPVATDRKAAAALRVDSSTVRRWLGGQRKIPGPVIAWLDMAERWALERKTTIDSWVAANPASREIQD